MKGERASSSSPSRASNAETFTFSNLVSVIGYKLTAYIGRSTKIHTVGDWLQNSLTPDVEQRMRTTVEVVAPIAAVESEPIAQSFLIGQWKETGVFRSPAQMLREADVETARSVLIRLAASEFLSNEVANSL